MENLVNIIYAFVLMRWSFTHPTRYVMGFLIYVSSYLGWFNQDLLIGGVEYGEFLFNLLALLPVVYGWKEIDSRIKAVILFLSLFYLYGLVKPIMDGHQGWMLSVKSSKSMTAYFFLFYVIAFYQRLDWNKIFRFVTVIAVYYAVLYLVNSVGIVIRPPFYVKQRFIQCFYDSFMLVAFCYRLTRENPFNLSNLAMLGILLGGIYVGGYFSLWVASLLILMVIFLYRKVHHPLVWMLLAASVALLLVIGLMNEEALGAIWRERQASLDSRTFYNEFRWQLIAREFLSGYGYLSRDTRLVSLHSMTDETGYMSDLTFVDAGYVDLMGRFGLIGTILLLLVPLYFLGMTAWNRQTVPFILMVFSFYAVNMTWSVFSYPQGIIVLALVYAFLYQNKKLTLWQES